MKILYDHQMFSLQRYGGITRYFCEIIKHIAPKHEFNLSLLFSDNYYLQEDSKVFNKTNIFPDRNFRGKYFLSRRSYELNQLYSKIELSTGKYDIFHPTFYNDYFLKLIKKPYIITVHDLIAFKFQLNSTYKHEDIKCQMENVIKNANRVITISENTKKDLIDLMNINVDKIDVIHHGYNKVFQGQKTTHMGNYILFVGGRDSYKNFSTCAQAVSRILQKEKGFQFICVGSSFKNEELELIKKLKIEQQTFAIRVDDQDLNNLYANAALFIYPSLYEGFGMPILEAFMNDCPVCLSNTSCFPEIAGNAGVYFDPYCIDSIFTAMEKVINDSDFAGKLRAAGKEQLLKFSWEKAASQTLESYQKAIL